MMLDQRKILPEIIGINHCIYQIPIRRKLTLFNMGVM